MISYSFVDSQEVKAFNTKFSDRTRTSRSIKSCGECRRRKQKCDQEQPCNNCRRRFPEPVCDYGSRRSAAPAFATTPKAEALLTPSQSSGSLVASRKQAPWMPIKHSGIVSKVSGRETHTLTLNLSCQGNAGGSTQSQDDQDASASKRALVSLQLDGVVYQCHLTGPVQNILHLPIQPTTQNAMLICKFSEILGACKGSFDGDSDSDNPFVLHYLPWSVQSPLLALSSLHTSARTMTHTGFVDQRSIMLAKGSAISKLNEYLRSDDDWRREEVLAAVLQFLVVEWIFGELEVAQAHLRGFRDIVRLRGGFPSHGVGALVTKSALVNDSSIALWAEEGAMMERSSKFEFSFDPPGGGRFKVRHNCPLGPPSVTFRSCEGVLGIHPATASILDDIRFLIDLALDAPLNPSPAQATKLGATAMWILDRIRKLNPKCPDGPANPTEDCDAEFGCHSTEDSTCTEVKPHSLLSKYPSYNSIAQTVRSPETASDEDELSSRTSEGSSPTDSTTSVHRDGTAYDAAGEAPKEDALYVSVRLAALIFAKAIANRKPLSSVCSPTDALALLSTTWKIPLSRWRGAIGIFIFLMLSIFPTFRWIESPSEDGEQNDRRLRNKTRSKGRSPSVETEETIENVHKNEEARKLEQDAKEMAAKEFLKPHGSFVKSIVQAGLTQMGVEDWSLCADTLRRALALQKWLGRRKT
ncbi:hypothetical protein PspLS_05882 [Pyricularia sp. CBS 133598]|nr:hypothetical protein PspLS_05882 [Pyricularia sp. CBS 133598]